MNEPGDTGQWQSGPGFESALRACLVSGVIVIEANADVATVTPEARKLLELPEDPSPQLPIKQLPSEIISLAREALDSHKTELSRQISMAQNFKAHIQVSATALWTASSGPIVVLTLLGFNPTNQFQAQIRQLDRLANTGTLAASMAHEIKNALVAGRTFLDLLLEKNSDAELVQTVRRENSRIDAIVSRMLRFGGSTVTNLVPLHLHEVLDRALRLVEPQLNGKTINLQSEFHANPDGAKGDENELQQAFINLVLNALEAMPNGGKLTVRTQNSSEGLSGSKRLRITVQDTGEGILPEHLSHLFEPFFTTKASGTGLGLAITQRIIQEHGGSITAESHPGKGTTFTILLPLISAPIGTQVGGFATRVMEKKRP